MPEDLDSLLSSLAPGGTEFEHVCVWLLQNAAEYRSKVKRVWRWDEWPGRWGADAGIDLVAETHDGKLWAVQAKHYAPAYAIRKADLDSFLSESARSQFSYRLLVATTDHLGATARRTIDAQEKPIGVLLRTALTALDVEWPSSPTRLRPAKPKLAPKPRPHQRHAIKAVVNGLGKHDRGQLVMACGTGKTLAARFLHDALGSRRTLVLVPSLSLVRQTLREWLSVSPLDYLAVCSDETVAAADHDAVIASTSELGVPVTTDPEEIASFLRRHRPGVVFATYQSSPRIADAQQGRVPAFDLALCDEAHRCTGPLAGAFTTILDPARIKARHRLFMTATPRYFTGRVKQEAKEADWEVASMDDEERFGPVLHRLTFAQAIEQDLLSDYQVVVVGVTDLEAHDLAERGAFVTRDGKPITDARTLARQIGLLRAMAKHDLHRVVSFHSRIDGASRFASSLLDTNDWLPPRRRASGEIWAEHVSGAMTAGEREVKLHRLRSVTGGERGILANARCLSEGVDVPTLDGVAFIDPRRSQVDVVQAVGRAIRKADDKSLGTIVIPVLVARDDDPNVVLASSEFDRVWEVVRALRDHDEDLADELDELRRGLGQRATVGERPGKIVLDLPTGITADFARAFDTKVVETATASWEFWFGLLERFVACEGHARVPKNHLEEGWKLGQWAGAQRSHRSRLSEDKRHRLEALPGWVWGLRESSWERAYQALRLFADREGHARPPIRHREVEMRIGQWVNVQRTRFQEGGLPPERVAALEMLPGWVWSANDADWDTGFAALCRFVEREGHARVRDGFVEGEYPLGTWVTKNRANRRDGVLSADRATRLEALPGWSWRPSQDKWETAFDLARQFSEREGHTTIPHEHTEDGFALGRWLYKQRGSYRLGRLSVQRQARLEALPAFSWDVSDKHWDRAFNLLTAYAAREGHATVPQGHIEAGFGLGGWVNAQRTQFVRGDLHATRRERLESIPGWSWSVLEDSWIAAHALLARHVDRTGSARVRDDHVESGVRLGAWARKQRTRYAEGSLSQHRVKMLEALPGWRWSPTSEAEWEESFALLLRYAEREGHARVPPNHREDGLRLGDWVQAQRSARNRGRRSPDREARLEALPRWTWDPHGDAWESSFAALKRYAIREGTARVRRDHIESGFALGAWCHNQRGTHRRGAMKPERATRLEALPGWTWVARDQTPVSEVEARDQVPDG